MRNYKLNRLRLWTLISALWIGAFFIVFGAAASYAQVSDPSSKASSGDYLAWAYPQGIEAYKDAPFAPGEILVGYYADQVAAAGLQSQLGLQVIDTVDLSGLNDETGDAAVDGYIMSVAAGSEWTTVERLLADPSVAFATPHWTVQAAGTDGLESNLSASIETTFAVNDTFYADRQWYAQRINASRAWQLAYPLHNSGNRPIRVAIVDSGVDFDHPELKPYLLPGWNYLNPGSPPIDDYGHGTHIAGVIAATLNNGSGISGMAPWVQIDPYKALNLNGGGTTTDVSRAIRDAVDNGADIVNLSIEISIDNAQIREAIEYAAGKNVLMTGAAGNCGNCDVMYPAAYSAVMAVAATDYDDERASYSARGPEVEIAAPGGSVFSNQPKIFSTWPSHPSATCASGFKEEDGGIYCNNTGTSMAASVVSGVAALVWGLDPSMPADDVRALLNRSAQPLPQDAIYVGSGLVDAVAAVRELVPAALEPSVPDVRHDVPSNANGFTSTIGISNPSAAEIEWTAELALDSTWVQIAGTTGPDTTPTPAQTVRYGKPGYVSLIFSPDQAPDGLQVNSLVLRGEVDGRETIEVLPISLCVGTDCQQVFYFPTIYQFEIAQVAADDGGTTGIGTTSEEITEKVVEEAVEEEAGTGVSSGATEFQWETPADEGDRIYFVMTDGSNREVPLPFTFPYGDGHYNTVRLHSDGVLTLPTADSRPVSPANDCLSETQGPANGIYGWWADLDPSQDGAAVSGFAVNSDRYVVEFANVPSAGSVSPGYVVSFQMVLDSDGDVKLNYLDAPSMLDRPPLATIGLESTDRRFRNQVFCADGTTTLRVAPGVRQSLRFTPKDIF